MKHRHIVPLVILYGAVLGLAACGFPSREAGSQTQTMIADAQAKSTYGTQPKWLRLTNNRDLFQRVRDRAYGYCLKSANIDRECASEQDDAVQASVLALQVATDQAEMKDKDGLGKKEQYVATNPEIVPRVQAACWALYREHGAADARILSVCLGNLTDYSPLIPLPVP